MTAMQPESYRDDYDLEPGVSPHLIHALHFMRTCHIAEMANWQAVMTAPARWPFPLAPIPPDRKAPPPAHPDAEDAPW